MQSEPKNERHPSGWEIVSLRTFADGTELMREKDMSSTTGALRLTVRFDRGSASELTRDSLITLSHTFSGIAALLTYLEPASALGKRPTPSE